VLIDFSPLKSGGGVQLAYNFLDQLKNFLNEDVEFFLLIPEGHFKDYLDHDSIKETYSAPVNIIKRYFFERGALQKLIKVKKIDTIFTFFGSGLPHPKRVRSVVGVAYPIICNDDSPFWKHITNKFYKKQKFINRIRINRLKEASVIFAETPIMKKRLMETLGFATDKIQIIAPSPSDYIPIDKKLKFGNNVLLLSGNSPHKNLWRLYGIALELKKLGQSLKFLVTVEKEAYISSLKETNVDITIIEEYFNFLGHVPQKEIAIVYEQSDLLMLLSDLESFSNNHMESWKIGIPQVVSDRDFTRGICRDSAVYIEPHDVRNVAEVLQKTLSDTELQLDIVAKGKAFMKELPTQKERMIQILNLVLND
jgi:glycosyltransferase involved in cell wall biosynthesis